MAMKSPEATIDFLLTCINSVEGKVDWEAVATKSGWYKAGKFSKQAFGSIQKKYAGMVIGADGGAPNVRTPKKTGAAKQNNENGDDIEGSANGATPKSTKKRIAVGQGGGKGKKAKTEAREEALINGGGEEMIAGEDHDESEG